MTYPKINKNVYERSIEDYREMAWSDARCSWCINQWSWNLKSSKYNEICPEFRYNRFAAYSAMGKFHIIRALLEGDFDFSDSERLLEIFYKCTSCGACEMNCLRLMEKEPLKAAEALKTRLIELGIGPLPPHKEMLKSIKNYDNPWLQPRARRKDWSNKLGVKDFAKEKCEILFFTGCSAALAPSLQHALQNTMKVLQKSDVSVGTLGEKEICCGSPAIRIGDRKTFFNLVKRNLEIFNKLGVKKIVTQCAGCHNILKHDYTQVPEMPEINYEVIHSSELVLSLIKEGRIKFTREVPMTVTWHDPCHLGRHCGIYEQPRDILKAIPGVRLVEMERIKDQGWCCGAGAGVKMAFPEMAFQSGAERIEEAKGTGAQVIATSCPFCEQNLQEVIDQNREDIKLYDLMDIVMMAI
jgi:heterodisulfide reductase subunit D